MFHAKDNAYLWVYLIRWTSSYSTGVIVSACLLGMGASLNFGERGGIRGGQVTGGSINYQREGLTSPADSDERRMGGGTVVRKNALVFLITFVPMSSFSSVRPTQTGITFQNLFFRCTTLLFRAPRKVIQYQKWTIPISKWGGGRPPFSQWGPWPDWPSPGSASGSSVES